MLQSIHKHRHLQVIAAVLADGSIGFVKSVEEDFWDENADHTFDCNAADGVLDTSDGEQTVMAQTFAISANISVSFRIR